MLPMEYPFIIREDLSDYDKRSTWKILHAYIVGHIQRLIDGYTGDGVQAISIIQHQCANMNFA